MKRIIRFFRNIISDNTLRVLRFKREEVAIFLLLFHYEHTPSEDLCEAMMILHANNEYWNGVKEHEFLFFGREIKALAKLCNDYSQNIAEQYGTGPEVFNSILTENYRLATDLYLKTAV